MTEPKRPDGALDPYHYDPDPEEIARIDELEQASSDWADKHPHPEPTVWEPTDPVKPWDKPGWVDPLAD